MPKPGGKAKRDIGIAKQALNYLKRGLGSFRGDDKRAFEEWRKRNPDKSFKEFFSETVEAKLRDGAAHQTLGGQMAGKSFGATGKGFFQRLVHFGLKPEDTLVDYGSGTLRMGIHAIRYLEPGRYWGLEISEFLLEQGRELVGMPLLSEKRPHLEVISPASVEAAAAAKPAMLISLRVLIHVHPDDLEEYFGNVMTIIGTSGQAIISGKWNKGTIRSSNRSWAHDLETLERIVGAQGGRLTIMREKKCDLEGIGQKVMTGSLRIVSDHAVPRH